MKIDPAKLKAKLAEDDVPDSVKQVMSKKGKVEDWAKLLRNTPPMDLVSAIAILESCATDKPSTKKLKTTTIKKAFVHHGDLVVKGNLDVNAPFWVTGDVSVSGLMRDCGPDSCVLIGGDLAVGSLFTDGTFRCGDIDAKGIVYGYYNDNTLDCAEIRARIVIEDEHDAQHAGVKAKLHLDIDDYAQGYGDGVTKKLKRHIRDEFFRIDPDDDEDEQEPRLDTGALFAAIAKGKNPFKR